MLPIQVPGGPELIVLALIVVLLATVVLVSIVAIGLVVMLIVRDSSEESDEPATPAGTRSQPPEADDGATDPDAGADSETDAGADSEADAGADSEAERFDA